MIDGSTLKPYDYVEDHSGCIFLIKGFVEEMNEYLAKVIYVPTSLNLVKCKTHFPKDFTKPSSKAATNAGFMDYLIDPNEIKNVYRIDECRISHFVESRSTVGNINRIVTQRNGTCFLFGSRRLDIESYDSDWDLLISDAGDPITLVNEIITELKREVRLFNSIELEDRVNRYGKPFGFFDKYILGKIFARSTLYLKSSDFEIGLFFTSNEVEKLPNVESVDNRGIDAVSGIILRNGGTSFHIPRIFKIMQSDGNIVDIISSIWELGGIETLAGSKVRFSGLTKVKRDTLWLGGEKALIEFL